ncbi:MAG: hypothetical protein ACYDH9_25980, partial [Limisphaerales bacterium]
WRKTLNPDRVGLMLLFFIPAVWQVQIVKPTLFFDFLWDGCDLKPWAIYAGNPLVQVGERAAEPVLRQAAQLIARRDHTL